jgi:hypothetical protein
MIKTYPGGAQIVAKKLVTDEALVSAGSSVIMGINQPANSFVEKVYLRVLEAPLISSGNIMLEVGTESDDPDDFVTDAGGSDNILDGGTTLPVNTVYDLTNATGTSTFPSPDFATGDGSSETDTAPNTCITEDRGLFLKFTTSTAVTTPGKFEITFVFRVFE